MRTNPLREILQNAPGLALSQLRHSCLSARERSLVNLTASICSHERIEVFHASVIRALESGSSMGDVKELILQLSIYVGFPKALQSLKRLKTIDVSHFALLEGSLGACSEIPTYAPSFFNFFESSDVQAALREVDTDFAQIALMNAIPLCRRAGLTPKERALVILASDLCGNAFEGPFQIHVEMLIQSGGCESDIHEVMRIASSHLDPDCISTANQCLVGIFARP